MEKKSQSRFADGGGGERTGGGRRLVSRSDRDWTPPATSPISRHFLLSFLPNRACPTDGETQSPGPKVKSYLPQAKVPSGRTHRTDSRRFTLWPFTLLQQFCERFHRTRCCAVFCVTKRVERMANKGPAYGLTAEVRSKVSDPGRAVLLSVCMTARRFTIKRILCIY